MAREIDMEYFMKLSWDNLYTAGIASKEQGTNQDRNRPGRGLQTGSTGKPSASEYAERRCSTDSGRIHKVNIDQGILGCSVNYWSDFRQRVQGGAQGSAQQRIDQLRARHVAGKGSAQRRVLRARPAEVYHHMQEAEAWIKDEDSPALYSQPTVYQDREHIRGEDCRCCRRCPGRDL